MDNVKINAFINKLSKETINDTVFWNHLTSLRNISEESNPAIFYLLMEDEWRHISYIDSYYAIIGDGEVYILNETNESGRDGTVVSGYQIYVHQEGSQNTYELPCSQGDIYRLLNSITNNLSKRETELESFIDSYLSDNKKNDYIQSSIV